MTNENLKRDIIDAINDDLNDMLDNSVITFNVYHNSDTVIETIHAATIDDATDILIDEMKIIDADIDCVSDHYTYVDDYLIAENNYPYLDDNN